MCIRDSLDTIQKTANEIILGIDEYYKELAKDIEQTEQETDYTQFTGWDFNGGYAAINTDANYLQVFFNEKPDDNIRAELKANGFHWEPKIKAWQQPLTGEVLNAADKVEYIRPLDVTLPVSYTHLPDEAFDRVNGNSDFQLGADSEKDSADGNPKQPDKNRAYQKKRVKTEKTAEYNIKEAVDAGDTVFDRVTEKEDFVFETRESKTEFSFRPSEDKTEKQTAGSKNRLYQEKQSKTESAENADTVLDIPEKGDFQFKRAEKAQAKADKLKGKAEKAQNKLPHKRKVKKQRVYDEKKKKAKTRLKFEKEIKPQSDIYHRSPDVYKRQDQYL